MLIAANAKVDGAGFCDTLCDPAHQHTPPLSRPGPCNVHLLSLPCCTADLSPQLCRMLRFIWLFLLLIRLGLVCTVMVEPWTRTICQDVSPEYCASCRLQGQRHRVSESCGLAPLAATAPRTSAEARTVVLLRAAPGVKHD